MGRALPWKPCPCACAQNVHSAVLHPDSLEPLGVSLPISFWTLGVQRGALSLSGPVCVTPSWCLVEGGCIWKFCLGCCIVKMSSLYVFEYKSTF